MIPRNRKSRIRTRLTTLLLIALVLSVLANGVVLVLVLGRQYQDVFQTKASILADSLRFKIERLRTLGLELEQMTDFSTQCLDLKTTYPEFTRVAVVDPWGNILYSSSYSEVATHARLEIPASIREASRTEARSDLVFKTRTTVAVASPLFSESSTYLGSVVVEYPYRLVSESLGSVAWTAFWISLLITAIMILLIRILILWWIDRPTSAMVLALGNARTRQDVPDLSLPILRSTYEFDEICNSFMGLFLELQDQKAQVQDHSRLLESMVAQRTAELEASNKAVMESLEELKQVREEEARLQIELERSRKMEAIGNLASGVAHDLNNILSGFVNYPELMLMEIEPDSPLVRHIKAIKQSGERAADMVQDLMTLARRGVALAVPINMNTLLREFQASPELLGLKSRYPGIALSFDQAGELPNVSGIPFHLTKALMNLINNSFEAIRGEGVVEVRSARVELQGSRSGYETIPPGTWLRIQVRDSGVGMDQATINRIFEPFFTKKVLGRRSGTGLGMSVVYSTVKEHSGWIDVESHPGDGSVISMYLVPTEETAAPPVEDVDLRTVLGRGETILVVDDLQEQRDIASQMLGRLGYETFTCSSGEAAIEWCKEHKPDVVLLDMIMDPGISGYQTYQALRQMDPGIRVIILSGYAENQAVQEMQDMGTRGYLKKPYRTEALAVLLRKVLEES